MFYLIDNDYCGKRLSDPLDPPSEETMERVSRALESGLTKNENKMEEILKDIERRLFVVEERIKMHLDCDTNIPCEEIVAVQELLRNSKHLKDKTLVITKDNACIL